MTISNHGVLRAATNRLYPLAAARGCRADRMFLDFCPLPSKVLYVDKPEVRFLPLRPIRDWGNPGPAFNQYRQPAPEILVETHQYAYLIEGVWFRKHYGWEPQSETVVIFEKEKHACLR
jgi:hypothetical protein